MATTRPVTAEKEDELEELIDSIENNNMDRVVQLVEENRSLLELEDNGNFGQTALHTAAAIGSIDLLELFVEKYGINVDQRDSNGQTAFQKAKGAAIEWLAQHGADIHAKCTSTQATALHYGALWNAVDKIKRHVQLGCDVDAQNKDGYTPLMNALWLKNIDAARTLLLEHNASVVPRNVDGNTALHLALVKGKVSVVQAIIDKGANVNAENNKGETPLLLAVHTAYLPTVKILVDAGAIVNAVSNEGTSVIDKVTVLMQKYLKEAAQLKNLRYIARLLLSEGASPRLKDANTPEEIKVIINDLYKEVEGQINRAARLKQFVAATHSLFRVVEIDSKEEIYSQLQMNRNSIESISCEIEQLSAQVSDMSLPELQRVAPLLEKRNTARDSSIELLKQLCSHLRAPVDQLELQRLRIIRDKLNELLDKPQLDAQKLQRAEQELQLLETAKQQDTDSHARLFQKISEYDALNTQVQEMDIEVSEIDTELKKARIRKQLGAAEQAKLQRTQTEKKEQITGKKRKLEELDKEIFEESSQDPGLVDVKLQVVKRRRVALGLAEEAATPFDDLKQWLSETMKLLVNHSLHDDYEDMQHLDERYHYVVRAKVKGSDRCGEEAALDARKRQAHPQRDSSIVQSQAPQYRQNHCCIRQ